MSPTSVAILTGVAAAHLGLAAYLYSAHFTPNRTAAPSEPPAILIEIPKFAPEPPPTPAHKMQPRTLPVHREPRIAMATPDRIEVQPPPKTPPVLDGDKVTLAPTTGGGQTVEPPRPRPVITDPHWLRQPTADEFADAYPQRALLAGKPGFVSLACTVTAAGGLADCSVAEESPAGWGFGAAGLSLSKRFRLVPRQEDGRPVGGAMIRIPIRFAVKN